MITESSVLNTRYRLEKKIGQGGFAQVFLATDLVLERRVALKVLNSELIDDSDFLTRFSREAKAIATLDHPNILAIHDFGQAEGTAFLVTPYIDGGTLYDKMRQEKNIAPRQASRYLQQIASALDYAHRRNIVHRDIKPHNMLLRAEDNHLFLADFGIAKVLSSASSQSRTSAIGTIAYMSPEQLAGNVSKATDIYALGCVLFQMLTGQVPFTGPTEQVIMGHIHGEIPSVVVRSHGKLSPAMQAVFDRALAKNPADRFATATEMSQAFDAALAGGPMTTTRPLPATSTDPYAVTQYEPTQFNVPPANNFSQQRTAVPPPNPNYHNQGPNTPPYTNDVQPGQYEPNYPFNNPPVPDIYPVAGGTPPLYPPPVQNSYIPPATPPKSKGPNLLLLGIIGVVALALIAVAVVMILNLTSPKTNPTQTAVAVITPTVTSQVSTTTTAAATTTTTAAPGTALPNIGTVTPIPSTAALNTTAPATTAVPTTAAPNTTTAATTVPPTTAAVTTAAPTTAAPTTAAPTTQAPTTAPPTKVGLSVDKAAINQALQNLPGTTSIYILLPDGQIISDDADRAQPSASTIKLWIAATFLDEARAGRINLNENYTVKQSDVASGTGILPANVGKTYTYGSIVSIMLTYSDNSGANILIRKLGGYDKVNSYIQRNQYTSTTLQRNLGDTSNPKNNFTSARDAATFMLRLTRGEIVDQAVSTHILQALNDRKNYNADQNFFSTKLTAGYQRDGYTHISGTGTKIRNEIGLLPLLDSPSIIIAILDQDMPNETAAENAIASAVQVVATSVKK